MKRIRILAIVLAVVMLPGIMAGCTGNAPPAESGGSGVSSQSGAASPAASGESAATDSNPYAEHLTIKWIGHNTGNIMPYVDTENQKKIEEMFNVTLDIVQVDVFNAEQWALFWAEGNTGDMINHGGNILNMYKLIDQGLFRTVDESLMWERMPKWMSKVESLVGKDTLAAQMKYKGENYFVPYKNYSGLQTFIMAVRSDWMEKVGVTSLPTTLDEMHDLMLKFVTEDPDGNGVADTYGIDIVLDNNSLNYIGGAYGVQPDSYYAKDGRVTYTPTTQNWKEMMAMLKVWYDEGIIDPEFVTDKREEQRKKWAEGKSGMLADHPWWFASTTAGNLAEQLSTQNPDAKVEYFANVEGPYGKGAHQGYPVVAGQGAIFFGKDTTDAQVERIMAIKEYLVEDWDAWVDIYYGKKDTDYILTDEGKIALAPSVNPEYIAEHGLAQYFALVPLDNDDFPKFTPSADMPPYEVSMSNNLVVTGLDFPDMGTNTAAAERKGDVASVHRAYFYDVITGRKDLDSTWDAYLAELDAAGLQEIIKGYEEML